MAKDLSVQRILPGGKALLDWWRGQYDHECTVVVLTESLLEPLKTVAPAEFKANLLSFSEFFSSVIAATSGMTPLRSAKSGHCIAAIELALQRMSQNGVDCADFQHLHGLHSAFAKTLAELRHNRIHVAQLEQIAEFARENMPEQPDIAERLEFVATLDSETRAVLRDAGLLFTSDVIEELLQCPPAPLGHLQLPIIVLLEQPTAPLWIDFFHWVAAGDNPVRLVQATTAKESALFKDPCVDPLAKGRPSPAWFSGLFDSQPADDLHSRPAIEILEVGEMLAEAEWAVRKAIEMEPEPVAIYARNFAEYAPLVLAASERFGCPVSARINTPLMNNPFARLRLDMLEVLASDDPRDLPKIAANAYWDLKPGSVVAINRLSSDARRKANPWKWLADQMPTEMGEHRGWIEQLIAWREGAADPRSFREWTHHFDLLRFLEPLEKTVNDVNLPSYERDLRAIRATDRTLNERALIDLGSDISLRHFVRIAKRILEGAETVFPREKFARVSLLNDEHALINYPNVIVLGMLEGRLPRRRRQDSVLPDPMREAINAFPGLAHPMPLSKEITYRERELFIRLCASASKSLTFTFPTTLDTRETVPTFYLEELEFAAGPSKVSKAQVPLSQLYPDEIRLLADQRLQHATLGTTPPPARELTVVENQDAIRPRSGEAIDIAELRSVLQCPFRAGIQYRIGLFQHRSRDPLTRLRRYPMRANLVTSADESAARVALYSVLDKDLTELAPEIDAWNLNLLERTGVRTIESLVKREFEFREAANSGPAESGTQQLGQNAEASFQFGTDSYTLRTSIDGLTKAFGRTTILKFRSSPIRAKSAKAEEVEDELLFFLFVVSKALKGIPLIAVDTPRSDRRTMLYFSNAEDSVRPIACDWLELKGWLDIATMNEFRVRAEARLHDSMLVMHQADLTAKPGVHCRTCSYGELCRVSRQYDDAEEIEMPDSAEGA